MAAATADAEQGLADQRVQQDQNGVLVDVVAAAHHGDGREVEAVREHRTADQQSLLIRVEQVIRRTHRVAQRLMAFQPASSACKQPEPVTQPVTHILCGHRHHPRRGQLDRQHNPIQALADLDHRAELSVALNGKPGVRGPGTFNEQLNRRRRDPSVYIQRRDRPQLLSTDP